VAAFRGWVGNYSCQSEALQGAAGQSSAAAQWAGPGVQIKQPRGCYGRCQRHADVQHRLDRVDMNACKNEQELRDKVPGHHSSGVR